MNSDPNGGLRAGKEDRIEGERGRVRAQGDPTLFVARYHRRGFGPTYGLEEIVERPGEAGYRWTKCNILEMSRADGTLGLDICGGHEAWWQQIAASVEDGPEVQVTQTMKDGAPFCEVWFRRRAVDRTRA